MVTSIIRRPVRFYCLTDKPSCSLSNGLSLTLPVYFISFSWSCPAHLALPRCRRYAPINQRRRQRVDQACLPHLHQLPVRLLQRNISATERLSAPKMMTEAGGHEKAWHRCHGRHHLAEHLRYNQRVNRKSIQLVHRTMLND